MRDGAIVRDGVVLGFLIPSGADFTKDGGSASGSRSASADRRPAAGGGDPSGDLCLDGVYRVIRDPWTNELLYWELLYCLDPDPDPGGGSGGGGGGEAGSREVEFKLECDGSLTRGRRGGCKVTAAESDSVDLKALEFAWSSSHASSPFPASKPRRDRGRGTVRRTWRSVAGSAPSRSFSTRT